MPLMIILLVIVVGIIIYVSYSSVQMKNRCAEIVERRRQYVEKLGPSTRIIVNNGTHFFFKDDEKQFFGIDESGRTYSFSGLHSVSKYKDGISFMHKDSVSLLVGKDYGHQESTISLDPVSINAIYAEIMPVLRRNLREELDRYSISPTHEYELDGEIWGCDINSKQFYCVYGSPQVFNFSDLLQVTVEDLRNNTLYDGSYIIHVYVKNDIPELGDREFDIHIKTPDTIYYNLLAMFKGIRNRQ